MLRFLSQDRAFKVAGIGDAVLLGVAGQHQGQAAITDVTGSALPPDRLTMDEKIRIVEDLQQAGIFYMKGAVSEVAAQLGSSEATIYRYLSKLKD